ncbi:MAG: DUF3605 domain-containing protein [Candidatus Moranbacteria bacterium]|nr:DUF3605 domain-containing protein [Candidatus Moranbacteria bacterium]
MELFDFDPPKNWEEFIALRDKIPCSVPEATRFEDDLHFYEQYTSLVPRDIRLKILDTLIGDSRVKLVRNNFPYSKLTQHLGKVTHFCLWSKIGPLSNDQVEFEIKKNFSGKPSLWFENVEATKSIPEVWHCHIFIKED